MTIELLIAPAATGKTAFCIDRIQTAQIENPLAQVWVFVPNLQTAAQFRARLAASGGGMGVLAERQSWQVYHLDEKLSGEVLGSIVHKAIQRWLFPGDPRLTALLEMETYRAGLVSDELRRAAITRPTELLARLRQHPLWEEINGAQERYSELPYTYTRQGKLENRVIDLLYRNAGGWNLLDFKTDSIASLAERARLVQSYTAQVQCYAQVARLQLQQPVEARLCFLDDQGRVTLVQV
jgi:ATP-dependent exoDNAse (exonuclease V) beta subunit